MAKIYIKIYNLIKDFKGGKISNGVNYEITKPTESTPLNTAKNNSLGFTLLEIIVSISVFVVVIILTGSIYLLSQQSYNKSSNLAELTQNNRVYLDRLSRELRQSVNIITTLPPTDSDPLNPPADQILFQDGHDISQITYLRYYLNGADLMREHTAYYFENNPSTYVAYNSIDQYGQPALFITLEDRIIGEYFDQIKFWGSNGLINIYLKLKKNADTFEIKTSAFSRN